MRGYDDRRVVFLLRAVIALAMFLLGALPSSAAPVLLGDSVEGALYSSGDPFVQFKSPAVVGDGIEFTGTIEVGKNTAIDVFVDIGASSFTIGWTIPFTPAISSSNVLVGLSLTGLDFTPAGRITGLVNTGYTCTPPDSVICSAFGGGPSLPIAAFTDDSVGLNFYTLRSGETYSFDFTVDPTAAPVPEPATLALFGSGLLGIAARWRRRATGAGRPRCPEWSR